MTSLSVSLWIATGESYVFSECAAITLLQTVLEEQHEKCGRGFRSYHSFALLIAVKNSRSLWKGLGTNHQTS